VRRDDDGDVDERKTSEACHEQNEKKEGKGKDDGKKRHGKDDDEE